MPQNDSSSEEPLFLSLYEYPTDDARLLPNHCATLGDMHGNALKMFHLLCYHGCVENDRHELTRLYYEFADLYEKDVDTFDEKCVEQASALVDQLMFRTDCSLRFIGDLLADRGQNDFLTILLFKRMHVCGMPYTIMLSNHDAEFFYALETNPDGAPRITRMPELSQFKSAEVLVSLIEKKYLSGRQLKNWVKTCIYPYVKIVDIDEHAQFISIYTHAPVSCSQIMQLHKYFIKKDLIAIAYLEKTVFEAVEDVNAVFTQTVCDGKIAQLLAKNQEGADAGNILRNFLWMRFPEVGKPKPKYMTTDVSGKGDGFMYVCGHDTKPQNLKTNQHWYSLDQNFGKSEDYEQEHTYRESPVMLGSHSTTQKLMTLYRDILNQLKSTDNEPSITNLLRLVNQSINCFAFGEHDRLLNLIGDINELIFSINPERLAPITKMLGCILDLLMPFQRDAELSFESDLTDNLLSLPVEPLNTYGFFSSKTAEEGDEPPAKRLKPN